MNSPTNVMSWHLSLSQIELGLYSILSSSQVRWIDLQRQVEGDAVLNRICAELKQDSSSRKGYYLEHGFLYKGRRVLSTLLNLGRCLDGFC